MKKRALLAGLLMSTCIASAYGANVINACGWNHPGAHPYKGGVAKGIDNYTDIPKSVQNKLKHRVEKMDFESAVTIGKDTISGGFHPEITDMHFGANTVCRNVNRDIWPKNHTEVGLVYCEGQYCLIVPTVCGNISRIRRSEVTEPVVPFIPEPKKEGKILPGLEPRGVPWKNPPATYNPIPSQPVPTPIPEPGTAWLMLVALVVMALIKRRH